MRDSFSRIQVPVRHFYERNNMDLNQHWVRDINSLYDFISYVVVYAPNDFPSEDYLETHEQMTLDMAFSELRRGIPFVAESHPNPNIAKDLNLILDEAFQFYSLGDDVKGAHRVQDFEALIFKRND